MRILTYKETLDVLEDLLDKAAKGGERAVVGFDMGPGPAEFMYLFRDGNYESIHKILKDQKAKKGNPSLERID